MRKALPVLSVAILLVLGLCLSPVAADPDSESSTSPSAAEVNAALRPPGGMKATQTGGNTVGDVIRESKPRADGYRHIDTPATIRALKRSGVNTYVYLIWNSPTDWDDLVAEFAPAAEQAGIRVWLYLVPPSECLDDPVKHKSGRCSRPYKDDYVKWAEEIAKLSVAHPNVTAWALDDFFSQLPPEEVQEMQRVQDEINPELGFYTTVYYGDAVRGEFYDRYEGLIDGIIYPYTGANSNTEDASQVGPNLDKILEQTEPRGLGVVLLAYTGRFLSAITPPTDKYIADVIHETAPYIDSGRLLGITLYGLPIAGGEAVSALNRARTGTGWLGIAASIFGRTEGGDYAQAEQRISVDPHARRYALEFSDYDTFFDQNNTASEYHTRQILVDGEVAWESDSPVSGGSWHRRYVDLTGALKGKRTATLTFRLIDKTSLGLWTGLAVDDLVGHGFTVRDGSFEGRDAWRLATNNKILLPDVYHFSDFDPDNAIDAAATAFAGQQYHQQREVGHGTASDAMDGAGRLALTADAYAQVPAGTCASVSQVLRVDPRSPRYEVDFFQTSPHAPYPGQGGAYATAVTVDGEPIWTRDANAYYPFWENGNGLQGPIDVTDFVAGKREVTLAFRMCRAETATDQPTHAVDVGFDHLATVGLRGRNFDFEHRGHWTVRGGAPGLSAAVLPRATRADEPRISLAVDPATVRAGTSLTRELRVTNEGAQAAGGTLAADGLPDGWSLEPADVDVAPVAAGATSAVPVTLSVPESAAEGSYWITYSLRTSEGVVKAAQRVQVIGDVIEFTPGTPAEAPWLSEPGGSQLDGPIFDGHGRFADGTTSFTYRFDVPDLTSGRLTLHIGNSFLVRVSRDGRTWQTVLTEENEVHNLENLFDRSLDVADLPAGDGPLYVRVEDSFPADGWGGWLGHLTLEVGS